MRKDVGLIFLGTIIYSFLTSWWGLLPIPAIIAGALCHELVHYLPLKPWDTGLCLEVWPFIEFRDHESSASVAHVGGEFSTSAPLIVVAFAMIGPAILFGLIPLAWVIGEFGTPVISIQRSIEFIGSPRKLAIAAFFAKGAALSPSDMRHFLNARQIREAGSLEDPDWRRR